MQKDSFNIHLLVSLSAKNKTGRCYDDNNISNKWTVLKTNMNKGRYTKRKIEIRHSLKWPGVNLNELCPCGSRDSKRGWIAIFALYEESIVMMRYLKSLL